MTPGTQISETVPIAVLGAGSWGTALAVLLAGNGHPTWLWGHNPDHMAALAAQRSNPTHLPGIPFPETLRPTSDLGAALTAAREILVVIPSHGFRSVLETAAPYLGPGARLAWATKGLETGTSKLLHQVVGEVLGEGRTLAVLSGPTFAREVAAGLPTAITVASNSPEFAATLAAWLHNENFRAYTSDDIVGVELGGAVKNVLAIAAGIADGLGFGANARAALITRGLAEIMRLGVALGGERETFMGLAGLGDLVLTCTDNQSRNRRFGLALAEGQSPEAALTSVGQTVEGVRTTHEALGLARQAGIEMPIAEQVARVLDGCCTPQEAVHTLLMREQKPETV